MSVSAAWRYVLVRVRGATGEYGRAPAGKRPLCGVLSKGAAGLVSRKIRAAVEKKLNARRLSRTGYGVIASRRAPLSVDFRYPPSPAASSAGCRPRRRPHGRPSSSGSRAGAAMRRSVKGTIRPPRPAVARAGASRRRRLVLLAGAGTTPSVPEPPPGARRAGRRRGGAARPTPSTRRRPSRRAAGRPGRSAGAHCPYAGRRSRARDRIDRLCHQQDRGLVRPAAETVANAEIDLGPAKVAGVVGDQVIDADVGVAPPERAHPRHQPLGGEGMGAGERRAPGAVAAADDRDGLRRAAERRDRTA